MKLEDIKAEFGKDARLKKGDFENEIASIGELQKKYQDIWIGERRVLNSLEKDEANLRSLLKKYYLGFCTQDELKVLGRVQYPVKILKNELKDTVQLDADLQDLIFRIKNQKDKVEYVQNVVSFFVYTRKMQIEKHMEYLKWTGGMQ